MSKRNKNLLNRIQNNMRTKMDGGTWSDVMIGDLEYQFKKRVNYRTKKITWYVGVYKSSNEFINLGIINELPKNEEHLELMLAFI